MQVTGGSHNQRLVKGKSGPHVMVRVRVSLQRLIVVPDGLGRRLQGRGGPARGLRQHPQLFLGLMLPEFVGKIEYMSINKHHFGSDTRLLVIPMGRST